MYVTRPLSLYRKNPSLLELPPPDGPNSGILVILDKESEPTCCFGLCKSCELEGLPFPQDKKLVVCYSTSTGDNTIVSQDPAVFIPVLDQPLSSNRYYAIQPRGRHKGEAFTNAKDEDRVTCLCFSFAPNVTPQLYDPHDIYQQFEIHPRKWNGFVAQSVAPDGIPPYFLRRKGWTVQYSSPRNFEISDDAPGLDSNLRAKLPDFNFTSIQNSSTSVVVGKWYCPFMFVKEGEIKDQMKRSMYYRMALEQRWEQIFTCDNDYKKDNIAVVDTAVELEAVKVAGNKVAFSTRNVDDGVVWFRVPSSEGGDVSVGLRLEIVDRMKLEEVRFGWIDNGEREVKIKRVEQFDGVGDWKKYACYVLVERFVLTRLNGSLVLTYDFKHTDKIRGKWE